MYSCLFNVGNCLSHRSQIYGSLKSITCSSLNSLLQESSFLHWSQRLSFIPSWQILRCKPLLLLFHWHEVPRAEKRKPLVQTVGSLFNFSTSHMIRWIKYLWGCGWSKENDIFDSCQVLSQYESEILNDLDQGLSFLSTQCFDQRFKSQISKQKKKASGTRVVPSISLLFFPRNARIEQDCIHN